MEILISVLIAVTIFVGFVFAIVNFFRKKPITGLQKIAFWLFIILNAIGYIGQGTVTKKTVVEEIAEVETVVEEIAEVETYRHKQCRLELHSENPSTEDSFVWDTEAFGTYDDGSVWVGYNRKAGDRVFRNLSKICN